MQWSLSLDGLSNEKQLPSQWSRRESPLHDIGILCEGMVAHKYTGLRVPDPGVRIPNSEFRTPNSEIRIPNSGIRITKSERRFPNSVTFAVKWSFSEL